MNKVMMLLVTLVLCTGCARISAHLVDKPRVDQEIPGEVQAGPVKTRQILQIDVVEKDRVSKQPDKMSPETKVSDLEARDRAAVVPAAPPAPAPRPAEVPVLPVVTGYKVEKDDTLQKISKKMYGSYGKWTKIYDANKAVIKDPNFLKPGITLTIPSAE